MRVANASPRITALGMPKTASQIGALMAATSAASDEMRKIRAVNNHVRQAAIPAGQNNASNVPRNVATPLPPLKPR